MTEDNHHLEARLQGLRPAPLPPAYVEQLAAIALDGADLELERALAALRPAALAAELENSILERTSGGARVVAFPAAAAPRRGWGRLALPAAAAVALLGAATALLVPTGGRDSGTVASADAGRAPAQIPQRAPQAALPAAISSAGSSYLPAGFDSRVRQANDQGVIWTSPSAGHRVVQVIYNDRVTVMDQDGRLYPVERPRVEYLLLPEEID